jgi:hypothetical protein
MSRRFNSHPAQNARFGGMRSSVLGMVALTALLAFSGRPVTAQVLFGSVVGRVTDASGASVPEATVRITEISTNDSRTVQTNPRRLHGVRTRGHLPGRDPQIRISQLRSIEHPREPE